MGKLIFWIVVIFGVLLVARLLNAAAARRRTGAGAAREASPMVRCVRCGTFVPRTEAVAVAGGHACGDRDCGARR